ncbi:hypothetical protein J7I94_19285 [Streptomyces sp. ISL-12]|uniref:hypothetical protein n=1 Tax=Streptomyces sp. ISL-12 TaxID=2819177 RepID=UPI001BE532FD|nr:hypothetical protein [Streptomyces sp. ISL-12]MBT2412678.1 hypothetical protein [Streptomyces sp. ISL-12]
MTMQIDGDSYEISPEAWEIFDGWRDKAYRVAWVVEAIEFAVRKQVEADLKAKAAKDWPGIGDFLADILYVVRGGPENSSSTPSTHL